MRKGFLNLSAPKLFACTQCMQKRTSKFYGKSDRVEELLHEANGLEAVLWKSKHSTKLA